MFAPGVQDGIKFADVLTVALTAVPSVTDGIKFSDFPGQIFNETLIDGIKLGDQLTVTKTLMLNIIEGIKFGDATSSQIDFAVSVSDGFTLGDIVAQVYYEQVSDEIVFGESIQVEQTYMVKAYFTAIDMTFTFKATRKGFDFVAKEKGLTFQAEPYPK